MQKFLAAKESSILTAAAIAREGGVLVYPTDTLYALGCDPRNVGAVSRLVAIKRREKKGMPVLCDSLKSAKGFVSLNEVGIKLAMQFWPGALTIVAPLRGKLPMGVASPDNTLGVRVPASSFCRKLLERSGGALVGTSANRSGEEPCRTAAEAREELGREVDMILDGGRLGGSPSTVVKIEGKAIIVLRQGRVGVDNSPDKS